MGATRNVTTAHEGAFRAEPPRLARPLGARPRDGRTLRARSRRRLHRAWLGHVTQHGRASLSPLRTAAWDASTWSSEPGEHHHVPAEHQVEQYSGGQMSSSQLVAVCSQPGTSGGRTCLGQPGGATYSAMRRVYPATRTLVRSMREGPSPMRRSRRLAGGAATLGLTLPSQAPRAARAAAVLGTPPAAPLPRRGAGRDRRGADAVALLGVRHRTPRPRLPDLAPRPDRPTSPPLPGSRGWASKSCEPWTAVPRTTPARSSSRPGSNARESSTYCTRPAGSSGGPGLVYVDGGVA